MGEPTWMIWRMARLDAEPKGTGRDDHAHGAVQEGLEHVRALRIRLRRAPAARPRAVVGLDALTRLRERLSQPAPQPLRFVHPRHIDDRRRAVLL